MTELSAATFGAYFEAIHGAKPFPWQQRLLEHVLRESRWPSLLDLPTGTGKTAAIDVALFHLAIDAASPPSGWRAPRRIVMVVDRRTVVDQAFERARLIGKRLFEARDGVLASVRERLGSLCDGEPLACVQLRGGMPRDDGWARRPDQPLVAVSTVDQVGSRLLFRGYGVRDRMRPIHAGLFGNDTLFLLDEVHLSQPFLETLDAVLHYRKRSQGLPDRWQFVAMSATPGRTGASFGLHEEDWNDERLAPRLEASKPVQQELVKGGQLGAAIARHVHSLVAPGRRIGVVVNRVATAIEIHRLVRDACPGASVHLTTGRMRPLDRTDRDLEVSRLVSSSAARKTDGPPVVVVATQCIEAGADFDFDALVTECASLDALRQRFGRLNRLGIIQDARGIVLARSDAVGKDATDFVYGEALAATWRWLEAAPRDFGIQATRGSLPTGAELEGMLPPRSRAPVMLPAHLDAWSQTAPVPRPDPDVSLWLHGVDQRRDADVQIVWRADITAEALASAADRPDALSGILSRLDVCPPSSLEALAVPIGAARAWLSDAVVPDITDIEGAGVEESDRAKRASSAPRIALLWRGDDSQIVEAADLGPGMTLVVPSAYGGLTDGTWDPSNRAPVADQGDRARWTQTRRPTLRLHAAIALPGWSAPSLEALDDAGDDERQVIDAWLTSMDGFSVDAWLREVLDALKRARKRELTIVRVGPVVDENEDVLEPGYVALVARGAGTEASAEGDSASLTGVEITLDEHMKGVGAWAERLASQCGLPDPIVRDLRIAGRWHDAGKVDPRFQRLLRSGSPLAEGLVPLAKSAIVAGDRSARQRAVDRSGYPKGSRHELSSVLLLQAEPRLLQEASDPDLVLHLVASHHGWCRPFAPVVDDPEPADLLLDADGIEVRASSKHGLDALDSGVAERFWRLIGRYGWYGLAWLEAIMRLADHRRSEWEQKHGPERRDA